MFLVVDVQGTLQYTYGKKLRNRIVIGGVEIRHTSEGFQVALPLQTSLHHPLAFAPSTVPQ